MKQCMQIISACMHDGKMEKAPSPGRQTGGLFFNIPPALPELI